MKNTITVRVARTHLDNSWPDATGQGAICEAMHDQGISKPWVSGGHTGFIDDQGIRRLLTNNQDLEEWRQRRARNDSARSCWLKLDLDNGQALMGAEDPDSDICWERARQGTLIIMELKANARTNDILTPPEINLSAGIISGGLTEKEWQRGLRRIIEGQDLLEMLAQGSYYQPVSPLPEVPELARPELARPELARPELARGEKKAVLQVNLEPRANDTTLELEGICVACPARLSIRGGTICYPEEESLGEACVHITFRQRSAADFIEEHI